MIRVAVLGAGFMGGTHARAYHGMDDVEIAGIFAPRPDRAQPLAEELGTSWTADLDALLTDPTIDAVDVCLPTLQHRATTEAALASGKHVLLEKPIAMTLDEADALIAVAHAAVPIERGAAGGPIVMMAHVLRFWPEYVEIARRVQSGEIGKPRSGFASRRQPFPAWSALFARADLTGGAEIDMMIHDFDALNWLFGEPTRVDAWGERNPRSGGIDQVQVRIDYANGCSALVDGGMMMPESYPFSSRFEILGDAGALEYAFRAGGRSVEMAGGVNELTLFPREGEPERLTPAQDDPYRAECAYFLDCIRSGRQPERANLDDARAALAVALAARDSIETGQPVAIA